jgi:hypothetical protein
MLRLPAGRLVLSLALVGALFSTAATAGLNIAAGPYFSQDSAFVGVQILEGATLATVGAARIDQVSFTGWDKAAVFPRPSASAPSDSAISILGGIFFAPLTGVLHDRSGRGPPFQFSV